MAERYRVVGMEFVRLSLCPAALLCAWLLLGSSWGLGPPGVGAAYVLDDAGGLGREFDGIGAISGGGVSGAGVRGALRGWGDIAFSERGQLGGAWGYRGAQGLQGGREGWGGSEDGVQ